MNGRSTTIILGNLTREIELSKTKSGKSIAKFTLAVNHTKEEVSYIDCVAWNQTAEFLDTYAKKGQMLYVEGQLKQNRFKDKDGNNRSKHEVTAFVIEILSKAEGKQSDNVPEDIDDKPVDLSEIPF